MDLQDNIRSDSNQILILVRDHIVAIVTVAELPMLAVELIPAIDAFRSMVNNSWVIVGRSDVWAIGETTLPAPYGARSFLCRTKNRLARHMCRNEAVGDLSMRRREWNRYAAGLMHNYLRRLSLKMDVTIGDDISSDLSESGISKRYDSTMYSSRFDGAIRPFWSSISRRHRALTVHLVPRAISSRETLFCRCRYGLHQIRIVIGGRHGKAHQISG
jgi:hypothetical protein